MNRPSSSPLVTIGIPLYRAATFVPRILHNIETIDYPNLEFLLADHHGLDDAMPQLRSRLGDDSRVRFFETREQIGWIENYNFLFRRASGRYFRLLTQDDLITPGAIASAVAVLERDPELIWVSGPVDVVDLEGDLICKDDREVRFRGGVGKGLSRDSLGMFGGWKHSGANLALIRVDRVRQAGLEIPVTTGRTGLSVKAWLFAAALRGGTAYVPEYRSRRCIHAGSFTSRHWNRSPLHHFLRLLSYSRAGITFLLESDLSTPAKLLGVPLVFGCGLLALPSVRILQGIFSAKRRMEQRLVGTWSKGEDSSSDISTPRS